jgi:hypothetical protein
MGDRKSSSSDQKINNFLPAVLDPKIQAAWKKHQRQGSSTNVSAKLPWLVPSTTSLDYDATRDKYLPKTRRDVAQRVQIQALMASQSVPKVVQSKKKRPASADATLKREDVGGFLVPSEKETQNTYLLGAYDASKAANCPLRMNKQYAKHAAQIERLEKLDRLDVNKKGRKKAMERKKLAQRMEAEREAAMAEKRAAAQAIVDAAAAKKKALVDAIKAREDRERAEKEKEDKERKRREKLHAKMEEEEEVRRVEELQRMQVEFAAKRAEAQKLAQKEATRLQKLQDVQDAKDAERQRLEAAEQEKARSTEEERIKEQVYERARIGQAARARKDEGARLAKLEEEKPLQEAATVLQSKQRQRSAVRAVEAKRLEGERPVGEKLVVGVEGEKGGGAGGSAATAGGDGEKPVVLGADSGSGAIGGQHEKNKNNAPSIETSFTVDSFEFGVDIGEGGNLGDQCTPPSGGGGGGGGGGDNLDDLFSVDDMGDFADNAAAPTVPLVEQHGAATVLQSKQRQKQAQVVVGEKREQKGAATVLQSKQRQKQAQGVVGEKREQKGAATVLQSKQRQKQAQVVVGEKREQKGAATVLQSKQRQKQAQVVVGEKREQKGAATVLQCGHRTKQAKRSVSERRREAQAEQVEL